MVFRAAGARSLYWVGIKVISVFLISKHFPTKKRTIFFMRRKVLRIRNYISVMPRYIF
jgi:hypothetical protein